MHPCDKYVPLMMFEKTLDLQHVKFCPPQKNSANTAMLFHNLPVLEILMRCAVVFQGFLEAYKLEVWLKGLGFGLGQLLFIRENQGNVGCVKFVYQMVDLHVRYWWKHGATRKTRIN